MKKSTFKSRTLRDKHDCRQNLMRFCPAMFMVLFMSFSCFAQDANVGAQAITSVTDSFASYISPARQLIYVIAAVISFGGIISIFLKMNNGDQDVKKTIMMVIGGAAALVSLATFLPKFFGY